MVAMAVGTEPWPWHRPLAFGLWQLALALVLALALACGTLHHALQLCPLSYLCKRVCTIVHEA